MGEAPGYEEAAVGRPFIGAAGSMLERILRRNRLQRGQFRIGNVLQCVPPGLSLEGESFQYSAIDHCRVHRNKLLEEGHSVVLAAGGTALRTLLGLHGMDRIRVEEFHGTVHDDAEGRFKIVPTFHTSYLQRGAHNLIGTVSFDLQVALEVARGQWIPQPLELIIDPPPDWFEAWVGQLESAARQDPEGVAVACDIETPDKAGGKPENELTPDDDSYQIIRHNFACHPDQGVTVPETDAYRSLIARVYAIQCRHYWWNGYGYDWSRVHVRYPNTLIPLWQLDLMIGAHVLQSDVPLGLGFWAPFYSHFGAWKYKSLTDPEWYACVDGPQTLRCGYGIIGDLLQMGQWRAFQEDCHELYHGALKPAQDVGILIDRPELERFHEDLAGKQLDKLQQMQQHVPETLRPLTYETGTAPEAGVLHPEARTHTLRGDLKKDAPDPIKAQLYAKALRVERNVSRTIQVCQTCGATEIHKKHRCKDDRGKIDKTKTPQIVLEDRLVVRWFWQEPFNPDSSKQMLAYIKAAGHKPGKNKKTREDSADRETLIRLSKSTRDPFYQINLDYRAVKKVDSTYAVPTMRRVDREILEGREPRLHPIPTFRPSTMRLCIAAGTPIEIARDLVEHPRGIPIEDIEPGMWAYSFDADLHLCLRRVVSVAKTGYRQVLRVHWMAGWGKDRRFGYADMTPEHEVRLRTGTYCPAAALQQGDSILAMTRGVTRYGYARLWATGNKPVNEHRFVLLQTTGEDPEHVHHVNHHTLDNRPENLEGQTRAAHLTYHGRLTGPTVAEGRRQRMLQRWKDAPEQFANRPRRQGLELTREWLVQALAWAEDRPTYVARRYKIDYATLMKYINRYGIECSRKPRREQGLRGNHTVVFIEHLEGTTDVYDLEIEDTHNFIAGELCVHNSYVSPNITNVVVDKDSNKRNLAGGFRRCVVAAPGCRLLEVDYSGIEAIETGWFSRDPSYIRLARLGVHAYLASHLLGRPADLRWADGDLLTYFKELKTAEPFIYDQSKRCVHGTNYGLTPYGMVNTFPDLYPDEKTARRVQEIYFQVCPTLPIWHAALRQQAYDVGFLGGPGEVLRGDDNACYKPGWKGPSPWPHPFQYRHWFWSVLAYKPISEAQRLRRVKAGKPCVEINSRWFAIDWGEDAKRVIAFYPQSTAAGVLKRTIRNLLTRPDHPSYIGDAYFGRTPLRAPIHDSLLLEVPDRAWDTVCEKVFREMRRPVLEQPVPASWNMGPYLTIGIDTKAGHNWLDVEGIKVPGMTELGLNEGSYFGEEEGDEEEVQELGVMA